MTPQLPSIPQIKQHAKRLRTELAAQGREIGHADALELLAKQHGFRDWNAFHAAIGNRPPEGWTLGGRVSGRYLSQPFEATVIGVTAMQDGWFRLELDFDVAVDVVTSEAFSNFRKRVQVRVGPQGHTHERTSDGVPHMQLDL